MPGNFWATIADLPPPGRQTEGRSAPDRFREHLRWGQAHKKIAACSVQ
jgi:hypothetical protein